MANDKPTVTKTVASRKAVSIFFNGDLDKQDGRDHVEQYTLVDEEMRTIDLVSAEFVPEVNGIRLTPKSAMTGRAVMLRIRFVHNHVQEIELPPEPSPQSAGPVQQLKLVQAPAESSRAARAVEDAFSYSVLTDDIGGSMRASPSSPGSPGGGGISQLVGQTLRDVLGWKVRDGDPRGFEGALTASFTPKPRDIDGGTDWTWTPRTYAVQTDLYGGISGAQASLYKRAQEALAQAMPLLDGLTPLNPEADLEDIAAFKAVIRTQLNELVSELASPGGPAMTRVESYFDVLLADSGDSYEDEGTLVTADPDEIGGTLGQLREQLGFDRSSGFVNSVEDEQNQTNYRILADYVTSLAQSWLNSRDFFGVDATRPFLGTQLVPISRQLSVIAESVAEVRFTLDSVFIGAAERQTIQLKFPKSVAQPMYAEDFLNWIVNFVSNEAPSYVKDGGKLGITNSLLPFARKLAAMTKAMHKLAEDGKLPHGFQTARVRRSVKSLQGELKRLVDLVQPLNRSVSAEPPHEVLRLLADERGLVLQPPELEVEAGSFATVEILNATGVAVDVNGSLPTGSQVGFGRDPDPLKLFVSRKLGSGERWSLDLCAGDTANSEDLIATFNYSDANGSGPQRTAQLPVSLLGTPD